MSTKNKKCPWCNNIHEFVATTVKGKPVIYTIRCSNDHCPSRSSFAFTDYKLALISYNRMLGMETEIDKALKKGNENG